MPLSLGAAAVPAGPGVEGAGAVAVTMPSRRGARSDRGTRLRVDPEQPLDRHLVPLGGVEIFIGQYRPLLLDCLAKPKPVLLLVRSRIAHRRAPVVFALSLPRIWRNQDYARTLAPRGCGRACSLS